MAQSRGLGRLDNQWCQGLGGQQVYDCRHGGPVGAIKLLCSYSKVEEGWYSELWNQPAI